MKISQLSVLAVLALAAPSAFAQTAPGGASTTTTTTTTGASSVTNAGSAFATDSSPTTDPALIDPVPKGEMANTGGEPELMFLAGLALASGGLLLRRKTGSQRA